MYYISEYSQINGPALELARKVKRLADFKGKEEGVYHVRTKRALPQDGSFTVRMYYFEDGKLQPHDTWRTTFLYNSDFETYDGIDWEA